MSDSDNNLLGSILGLGEEHMGELVNQLLANEIFTGVLQNAIVGSVQARRSVDKNLSRLLGVVNMPSLDDVAQVNDKLDEVESLLDEIQTRVSSMAKPKPVKKTTKKKAAKKKATKKKATKKS